MAGSDGCRMGSSRQPVVDSHHRRSGFLQGERVEAKPVLLPSRYRKATLVDLLDRVLEKGLVINADIIISLAGIPLLGVNLRAALAGMETMLKYGLMREWDERTREWERKHIKEREPPLLAEEEILLRMYGAHWHSKGIYRAWQPGYLYLTNKRLFLFRREPGQMLFEAALEKVKGLAIKRESHFMGIEREMIYLALNPKRLAYLYAERRKELLEAIRGRMKVLGLPLNENPVLSPLDAEIDRLIVGDEITAEAKMWYQLPASGIRGESWRRGRLYLTNKRLFWWCNEDCKILFEVPRREIGWAKVETRDLGGAIKERPVLCLSYGSPPSAKTALFVGDDLTEWEKAINHIGGEVEPCPCCERLAPTKQLLKGGCPSCGWVSPCGRGENEAQPPW